jgi:transposase
MAIEESTLPRHRVATTRRGLLSTGAAAAATGAAHGIELAVVKLEEAKRGFVLPPRHWVVERSFAWATRFRRLARDHERLPSVLEGLHVLAFACLMLRTLVIVAAPSP